MATVTNSESDTIKAARRSQELRVFRLQVAGFAIAGLLVLALSLWRSGWHNVFTPGWWRW